MEMTGNLIPHRVHIAWVERGQSFRVSETVSAPHSQHALAQVIHSLGIQFGAITHWLVREV